MTNLSNIVEVLAKQALGGNQQASGQGGLGGILGSVLGQMGVILHLVPKVVLVEYWVLYWDKSLVITTHLKLVVVYKVY